MPTVVQFRRGTTAQNDNFTGSVGELSIDTDKQIVRVHDGSTAGGYELLGENLTNQKITGHVVPSADITYNLGDSSLRWNDLYLSGNTIYIGETNIHTDGTGGVVLPAGSHVDGAGFHLDSDGIHGLFSAGGDLTYNSSTGEFSIDVEEIYTQTNFDSDFNVALDAASIGGVGLDYNATTNTLSIDSADLYAAYKHDDFSDYVADEHVAHTGVVITAGAGLTGGGDISTTRTLNVGAGNGITVNADDIQIDSASNVVFNTIETTSNVTIGGNLTVSGTTTTVNTETIELADNVIVLNSNEAGTPSQNGGIEIERGTSANKTLVWDETADKWTVGSETFVANTFEGDLTGNADTATALETARTFSITGDAVASGVTFDGTGNVTLNTTIANFLSNTTDTFTGTLTISNGDLVLDEYILNSQEATLATTAQTAVATFSASTYGTAEVTVAINDGSARHTSKFLIVHDGSTAYATEYGIVTTGSSLATFDVDINGGNVRLLATPASTNSMVYKIALTLFEA